jgi:hypothetical protein
MVIAIFRSRGNGAHLQKMFGWVLTKPCGMAAVTHQKSNNPNLTGPRMGPELLGAFSEVKMTPPGQGPR